MDEDDIKQVQKSSNTFLKYFLVTMSIFFIIVIADLVIKYSANQSIGGSESPKEARLRLQKDFSKDSLLMNSSLTKTTYKQNEVADLVSLYNKVSKYPSQFDNSKSKLLHRFDPIKVIVETGTIYFDEFTEDTIKQSLNYLSVPFIEYVSLMNLEKYSSRKVYSGYKNSVNRKAHELFKKYSWTKEDCLSIAGRGINIGMNKNMVIAAWGKPYHINTTTNVYGVHEQWVYGKYSSSYVYFDDGIVTTIQH
ncbi:MAG: hypothetical protein ACYC25_02630 [Paludibacter sp.]